MGENFLFREGPVPVREAQLSVAEVPRMPQLPIHIPSFVLGILSLVGAVSVPLLGLILGFIGRVTGASSEGIRNVTAGKICCNVGMVLSGFVMVLTWLCLLIERL